MIPSKFLLHSISGTFRYTAFNETDKARFLKQFEHTNALQERVWDLIAERCGRMQSEVEELYFHGDNDFPPLSAQEACERGLVDDVVTTLDKAKQYVT